MRHCLALPCFFALLLVLAAAPARADEPQRKEPLRQELRAKYTGPEIVEKLKAGGYVLLMRHMATVRSPDTWSGVVYEDCSTQRVLSDLGKQQARELGAAFQKLEIPVGEILTSPYCRTRETAALAFGKEATVSEVLTTWDDLPVDQKTARGTDVRKMLDTPPAAGTNTVLVTHTGNLLWSLGLDSKPEGLAHVFKPTGLSIARPTYLGRIEPQEWRSLSGLPPVAGEPAEPEVEETPAP